MDFSRGKIDPKDIQVNDYIFMKYEGKGRPICFKVVKVNRKTINLRNNALQVGTIKKSEFLQHFAAFEMTLHRFEDGDLLYYEF